MNKIRTSMIATLLFLLKTFVNRRSSSPNQFVPEIVSPLPCSSGLVRHILLFVYSFKELTALIDTHCEK